MATLLNNNNNYTMSSPHHLKLISNNNQQKLQTAATIKTLASSMMVAKGCHQQNQQPPPPPNDNVEHLVVRKRPRTTQPLSESTSGNIMTPKKPSIVKLEKTESLPPPSVVPVSSSKKGAPLPVAVARRNARERNRVKQVNNGFAALRERIPEELAESFEAAATTGRCSTGPPTNNSTTSGSATKKLSKVETLRMAVEYIRNLEMILANDGHQFGGTSVPSASSESPTYSMEATTSPLAADHQDCAAPISGGSVGYDDDSLIMDQTIAEITVIDGHQYVRLPGTNTFQLLSAFYAPTTDDEMNDSLIVQPPLLPTNYEPTSTAYLQQHILSAAPASPPSSDGCFVGVGDGHTISPVHNQTKQEYVGYIIDDDKDESNLHSPSAAAPSADDEAAGPTLYMSNNSSSNINRYEGVITLKQEMADDDNEQLLVHIDGQQLSAETMMEAIDWWDKTNLDGASGADVAKIKYIN